MKRSKKYRVAREKIDKNKAYTPQEAVALAQQSAQSKFDESVDVCVKLGVDPKKSDQQLRGAVAVPHGLGRKVRVLVFAKGAKEEEAKKAGADFVGGEDLVEKIKQGFLDFDKTLATPDMMASVSKVAKILGPRALMPNPKVGTVTMNVGAAVEAEKKGKISYRTEKAGLVHASIGRKSMEAKALTENLLHFIGALLKAKPSSSKGVYVQKIVLSSTFGPGIKVDATKAQSMAA